MVSCRSTRTLGRIKLKESEKREVVTEGKGKKRAALVTGSTSEVGIRSKEASVPYSVSKAALNHMTKLLALNLALLIRVNAIAPSLVKLRGVRIGQQHEAKLAPLRDTLYFKFCGKSAW